MLPNKENIEILFVLFNISWMAFCIFICWAAVRFEGFRRTIKSMIENADNRAEHEDGNKVLVWGAALGFFWLSVNTTILALYYGPDTGWYIIIGIETTALGALLGINIKRLK